MNKDFDTWNKLKKQIQERPIDFHVKPRQIWWCSLGINIVEDENLHRSSVILSQMRVVSPKRLLRQVGWISETQFLLVAQKLQEYFCINIVPEMSKPPPEGEGFSGPEGISDESIPEIENNTTPQ